MVWAPLASDGGNEPPEMIENYLLGTRSFLGQMHWHGYVVDASDALTGLVNRRRFNETLPFEHECAWRSGLPFSLIMVDVDYFKKFTDRNGDVASDYCLRRLAGTIATGPRRPTDLAGRYSGKKFAVILPDIDTDGACAMADKVV